MEEEIVKRIMPHSNESEQSVLGAMLMDSQAISSASEILTGDDFYNKQYGVIFDAMVELSNSGRVVDLVTLQDKLKEKNVPPEVSSLAYVREFIDAVPTSANVKAYAQIVYEKSVLRKMIKTNEEISKACYEGTEKLEKIFDDAEKKVFEVVQRRGSTDFVPIEDVVMNALEAIEKAGKAGGKVTFKGKEIALNAPRRCLDASLAFVSEDRRGVGLLLDESLEWNIAFPAMQIQTFFQFQFTAF